MNKIKKFSIYFGAITSIFMVAIIAQLGQGSQEAYAKRSRPHYEDMYSCISGSGASNALSVQTACNLCFSQGKTARGALWFNSSSYDKNSDVVSVADPNATTAQIFLWGQTFACGEYPSSSTAYHIWFGRAGRDTNYASEAVPYLLPNNASTNLYRGLGDCDGNGCYSYVWTDPAGVDGGWTLLVQEFKNDPDTRKTVLPNGLERYEAMVSVNRCYHNSKNGISYYSKSRGDCYGEDSHIVLEIPAGNSNSNFNGWTYSTAEGQVFQTYPRPDGTVFGNIEVDKDKVDLAFTHSISYVPPMQQGFFGPTYTDWYVEATENGQSLRRTELARYNESDGGPGPSNGAERGASTNILDSHTYSVEIAEGETKKVCSTIYYSKKIIVWDGLNNNYVMNIGESNGIGSSTSCITVKRGKAQTPESVNEFTSQSFVQKRNDNTYYSEVDGMLGMSNISLKAIMEDENVIREATIANPNVQLTAMNRYIGRAGFVGYPVKLDDESTDIDFWHKITYTRKQEFADADEVPKVKTEWTIKTRVKKLSVNLSDGSLVETGWESLAPDETGVFEPTSAKVTQTSDPLQVGHTYRNIPIEKGQTLLICSTIEYKPKFVKLKVKTDGDIDGELGHAINHIKYIYEIDTSFDGKSGSSESCAMVSRPIEPQGHPTSGDSSGEVSNKIMFAGEATQIGWNMWARGNLYYRIKKFQAFNYIASAGTRYNNDIANTLKGDFSIVSTSERAPCTATNNVWSSTNQCTSIPEHSGPAQSIFFDKRNETENIVVPNEVGRKHANSGAYFYERWYFHCHPWSFRCRPHWCHHTDEDYWYIKDSASRSIAKKPTIALWNGGLFTQGGVSSSLANRYAPDTRITYRKAGGATTKFGSWSEYLAVLGTTNTKYFTSGAVLATGLKGSDFEIVANSPLTIANNGSGSVGGSGITTNSILRERLQQYFFSKPTRTVSGSLGAESFDKTTIIKADGDLKITGDITINRSAASTIYDLPQVLIYATGNITIESGVKQVDAWLVTDGELNTCGDFVYNSGNNGTEARVTGATKTACSNNLQINGPVFAKKVVANRTYGADGISPGNTEDKDTADNTANSDTRAATAEVFNLSAENYLWAYAQAGRYGSSYTEAYSRELPPRY